MGARRPRCELPSPQDASSGSAAPRAIASLSIIVTPIVAKHRLFVWLSAPTLPDKRLTVVAREDDYAFGVLHSSAHEHWALRTGSSHGVGNDPRYTPTTTFETFPFPWPVQCH